MLDMLNPGVTALGAGGGWPSGADWDMRAGPSWADQHPRRSGPGTTSLAPLPMCPGSQKPAPYHLKAGPHQIPSLPTPWSRTSHPSRTVGNQLLLFMSHSAAAAAAKSLQPWPTLGDPIDGSPPGSPVPGILQAGTLEWVAISFSNAWKWQVKVKSLSRPLTLSDPMDCSPPGSSVHGIFQAGVLEWAAKPLNPW